MQNESTALLTTPTSSRSTEGSQSQSQSNQHNPTGPSVERHDATPSTTTHARNILEPIVIINFMEKGGVGKSTNTFNFAERFNFYGLNVLMVDADHQRNLTTACFANELYVKAPMSDLRASETQQTPHCTAEKYFYTIDRDSQIAFRQRFQPIGGFIYTMYDAFHGIATREAHIISAFTRKQRRLESTPVPRYTDRKAKFHIFPGHRKTHRLDRELYSAEIGISNLGVPTFFVQLFKSYAKENGFDIIMFDIGPNIGPCNKALLMGSDYIILPTLPDPYSVDACDITIEDIVDFIANPTAPYKSTTHRPMIIGSYTSKIRGNKDSSESDENPSIRRPYFGVKRALHDLSKVYQDHIQRSSQCQSCAYPIHEESGVREGDVNSPAHEDYQFIHQLIPTHLHTTLAFDGIVGIPEGNEPHLHKMSTGFAQSDPQAVFTRSGKTTTSKHLRRRNKHLSQIFNKIIAQLVVRMKPEHQNLIRVRSPILYFQSQAFHPSHETRNTTSTGPSTTNLTSDTHATTTSTPERMVVRDRTRAQRDRTQADNSCYSEQMIDTLLLHEFADNPNITCISSAISAVPEALKAALTRSISEQTDRGEHFHQFFYPIHQGHHWVALEITYNPASRVTQNDTNNKSSEYNYHWSFNYFDSLGYEINNDLQQLIQDVFDEVCGPNLHIFPHGHKGNRLQNDNTSCGAWVVEAFRVLSRRQDDPSQYPDNNINIARAKAQHQMILRRTHAPQHADQSPDSTSVPTYRPHQYSADFMNVMFSRLEKGLHSARAQLLNFHGALRVGHLIENRNLQPITSAINTFIQRNPANQRQTLSFILPIQLHDRWILLITQNAKDHAKESLRQKLLRKTQENTEKSVYIPSDQTIDDVNYIIYLYDPCPSPSHSLESIHHFLFEHTSECCAIQTMGTAEDPTDYEHSALYIYLMINKTLANLQVRPGGITTNIPIIGRQDVSALKRIEGLVSDGNIRDNTHLTATGTITPPTSLPRIAMTQQESHVRPNDLQPSTARPSSTTAPRARDLSQQSDDEALSPEKRARI